MRRFSALGQIAAGIVVGLLVVAGWFATGYLANDDFNPAPVASLTFIAPIADSVQYVMLSTGSTLNFGIATVGGVFAGSLITALATGRFELEGYRSPQHMLRSAGGAALMGTGGVMAFGCSVGQGLTGLSTLSVASFIAVAGIVLGTASACVARCGCVRCLRLSLPRGSSPDLRRQCPMHRTFVSDFDDALALLGIERAFETDRNLDLVEHALLRFAFLAILA